MAITHAKVLTGADGTHPDRAQPSDWNDDHVLDLTDIDSEIDSSDVIKVDTIAEHTGSAGVTIDSVLLKDRKVSADGIIFPATQVPSANANTLDDYEEGTWTPALTFATPGDLSVTYSAQSGNYTRIGRLVIAQLIVTTSAFTHTTASGNFKITGLPFTVGLRHMGDIAMQGWTATINWLNGEPEVGDTYARLRYSRSGNTTDYLSTSGVPTGGSLRLYGTFIYTA